MDETEPRDYTPHSDKAEWHLAYHCTLACPGCNRASFLPQWCEMLTLADAAEFARQARELAWSPRIMIIGGEPTLNPVFREIVQAARDFTGDPQRVEVWSNGFTDHAKAELAWVEQQRVAVVQWGTAKTHPVNQPVKDIFIAPADYGRTRKPCDTHSAYTWPDCGISVDHDGYSLCCMGGAIDGLLKLGIRTKRLADLFDPEWAAKHTAELCRWCGQYLGTDHPDLKRIYGTLMSPSWAKAVRR